MGTAAPATATAPAVTTKKPTRVKTVDPNETPEMQFKRLAVPRTVKALTAARQLKNLARLKPTAEQTAKVFDTITAALKAARMAWEGVGDAKAEGFNL
jgi:hypothetical protein